MYYLDNDQKDWRILQFYFLFANYIKLLYNREKGDANMLFLGLFDFLNDVKTLQILLTVLLVAIIFVIIFFVRNNSKYKKTLYLIFSVIDDKAEIQVKDIIFKTKKIEEDLKQGKIKEYNTKVEEINNKFNGLISDINKIYNKELKEKNNAAKEKLKKIVDKQEKSQTKAVLEEEIHLRKKAKKIEIEKINTDRNAELLKIELDYKPALDYFKQIKLLKKDTKALLKVIKNIKKHEYKIPDFTDNIYETKIQKNNSEQKKDSDKK